MANHDYALSYESLYSFDVFGFVIVDGTAAPNSEWASSRQQPLEQDRRLGAVLDQLFAGGVERLRDLSPDPRNLNIASAPLSLGVSDAPRYHIDRAPRQLGATDLQLPGASFCPAASGAAGAPAASNRAPLVGGGDETLRLGYLVDSGVMLCGGVEVLWALDDDPDDDSATLTVLPASHRSTIPAPPEVLSGARPPPATALPLRLKAGQLLIMAATTLRTAPSTTQSLWQCDFVANWVAPSLGYAPPSTPSADSEWLDELSPEERAIVGPRLTGQGGAVDSDGAAVSLHADTTPRSPDAQDDALADDMQYEMWEWDLNGFIVIKGVMDEAWCDAANSAVDAVTAPGQPDRLDVQPDVAVSHQTDDGQWPKGSSERLVGGGGLHHMLRGLTELPSPHCEPFRRMIANPHIVQRLNWMVGPGFHESGPPYMPLWPRGTAGFSLHGQAKAALPHSLIRSTTSLGSGGRASSIAAMPGAVLPPLCDQVNCSWQLRDVSAEDGGFCAIPVSTISLA
jgi:hypothetical protein